MYLCGLLPANGSGRRSKNVNSGSNITIILLISIVEINEEFFGVCRSDQGALYAVYVAKVGRRRLYTCSYLLRFFGSWR